MCTNTITSCTSQPNRHRTSSPVTWPCSGLGNQCWQLLPTRASPSVVGYQDYVRLLACTRREEAWCGQRRRRSTFRTESSSGEEDESAAAPYSSSVTGAAIKRKRTFDKFLALRIVCGKGPKGQACWLRPAQSKETLS